MRLLFLALIFYSSNILSLELNQSKEQDNFFDKNPAEQRNIFAEKFKNIISKIKNTSQLPVESVATQVNDVKTVESLLMESLKLISNGDLDHASKVIEELIVLAPNFKLAHLIRGDILTAYSMSIDNFGGSALEINSNKVKELKRELQQRIKGYLVLIDYKDILNKHAPPIFNILPAEKDKYLIYVDMDSSRLFVFQKNINNKYSYLSDHYVSIGKNGYGKRFEGDKKTPYGTYFLQKKIQRKLTDFYGDGAYPLNYPNKFDKINKYTGSGIWVHGTPKSTYSRPPEASDGCIVLSNKDLVEIENVLNTPGTPIILSNLSISTLLSRAEEDIKQDQKKLLNSINKWKEAWEKASYDEYINFYSLSAKYNDANYNKWSLLKKNVFKKSKNIQVLLGNISIYEYPSARNQLRIVLFEQDYSSNLINNKTKKKQIWKVENGKWRIIYEGTE